MASNKEREPVCHQNVTKVKVSDKKILYLTSRLIFSNHHELPLHLMQVARDAAVPF